MTIVRLVGDEGATLFLGAFDHFVKKNDIPPNWSWAIHATLLLKDKCRLSDTATLVLVSE